MNTIKYSGISLFFEGVNRAASRYKYKIGYAFFDYTYRKVLFHVDRNFYNDNKHVMFLAEVNTDITREQLKNLMEDHMADIVNVIKARREQKRATKERTIRATDEEWSVMLKALKEFQGRA